MSARTSLPSSRQSTSDLDAIRPQFDASTGLSRLLLSSGPARCPFGCTYCFADFSQYVRAPSLLKIRPGDPVLNHVDILYPACDTDIFADPDGVRALRHAASLGKSLSISTKARLHTSQLKQISAIAKALAEEGLVLKVGVSFATKHRVAEIEPRTPSYNARLETLMGLAGSAIATSVVLRPLLVDVPETEYLEIIDDTAEHSGLLLLGNEWLASIPRAERRNRVEGEVVRHRVVEWIPEQPLWRERLFPGRMATLQAHAEELGWRVFDSDISLMRHLLDPGAR